MATLGAALATLLAAFLLAAAAEDHIVGGAAWRIPTSPGLYRAWADNRTVYNGDTLGEFLPSRAPVLVNDRDMASDRDTAPPRLVFRFETGFYDVVQVGRREFDECTADDPYQLYRTGPAVIHLEGKGVRYYVCTAGNYCSLGVKMYVVVEPR
ncbi:umecyanin-like [Panicum miliaceum]|uniref:Umecyanin-like n=1 Tax=Panicum miliaceum TaxID=4540 RepID=A0A3L6TXX8_PANMI|nr:umecyanin-like [Panicum miliaceum]